MRVTKHHEVTDADLEALIARSVSSRRLARLIKAGLAVDDGCGGWYITLAGQRAANAHEMKYAPLCEVHAHPFEDGECPYCEHDKDYY